MKMIISLVAVVFGGAVWAAGTDDVLGGADARIEQYRKGDAELRLIGPDGKPIAKGTVVTIEQTGHKFLFGCNIFKLNRCRTPDDEAAYRKRFADLLNYATLPFYWWSYGPPPNPNNDDTTDKIVAWCRENGITTKGHPLAWNFVDPRWLRDTDSDRLMEMQFERIEQCVERFAGKIDIWDVVNEATHYDRPEPLQQAPKLTAAIKKIGVGPYVRTAFETARRAGPNATLIINDYRTDPEFADKVIRELVDKDGKAMYDVIGIQSHMHGSYWGAKRTWEVCEYFAKFGKPLHFTEVTVVSGPRTDAGWKTTPDGEAEQARQVAEFYTVLFSHPAVTAITWWDFTDQGAWQRAPAGFLREDMSPKPAYDELMKRIKGAWWTRTQATVGDDGKAAFRGFLGTYRITAATPQPLAGTFSLTNRGTTQTELRLGN